MDVFLLGTQAEFKLKILQIYFQKINYIYVQAVPICPSSKSSVGHPAFLDLT